MKSILRKIRPITLLCILCLVVAISSACSFSSAGRSIESVKAKAVDKGMTDETAAMLDKMFQLKTKGTMIGQHDGVWMEEQKPMTSYISELCGRFPAVASYDFMFITNVNNTEGSWFREREHEIRERIIAAHRAGLMITMCWHYNDPYTQKTFYVSELESEELKWKSFKSILPGGENHERYKKDLRKVAEFSQSLLDDNGKLIPFIFRPFHEFDGDWFWWGAAYNEPEEFKALWQFTVRYLRDELGVHNMLYAFSPDIKFESREDYLLRYPGDDYVDILGFDDYEDFKYDDARTDKARERIRIVGELAKEKGKLCALTETGYFISKENPTDVDVRRMANILKVISDMYEYLSYAAFWGNGGGVYCVPVKDEPGSEEFRKFLEQPFIILNDNK